jgi:hypothetical protein
MINKAEKKVVQNKTHKYTFAPAITTLAFPILMERRKNNDSEHDKSGQPSKLNRLVVEKYELSNDFLKFYVTKGFPKKRWASIKEIPVYEITSVECSGCDLRLSWKGSAYEFIFKEKNESFIMLCDQIRSLLEGQRKNIEINEKTNPQKNDLKSIINFSIGIVDFSFNILMELSRRKISWDNLERYIDSLETNLAFKGQTMEPLNVAFGDFFAVIRKHAPKETSKEAIKILKTIYSYFDALKADENLNIELQNVKTAILAYYALNDLIFANLVDRTADEKENLALESALLSLADKSNFKVNFGELKARIDRVGVEEENQGFIEDARSIFKDQLKLLWATDVY